MTNKIPPIFLGLMDFTFDESEINRLEKASGLTFTRKNVNDLTLIFGTYLGGTLHFLHSALPTQAKETLNNTKTALNKASKILEKLCGINDSNALIIRSLSNLPQFIDLPFLEKKKNGLQYLPSHAETGQDIDQNLAVGNLIDYQLGLFSDNEINLTYLYGILQMTLDSIELAQKTTEISSGKGGKPGDPNLTVFLIDLLNVICRDHDIPPYSTKAIDYIYEARIIIAERLKQLGENKASTSMTKIEKASIIDRIQTAIDEDAKTYKRFRSNQRVS